MANPGPDSPASPSEGSSRNMFLFVVALCTVFYGLNYFNQSEIGIFTGRYIPLAESIQQLGYSYPWDPESAATYPMWGYPILVALLDPIGGPETVYFFQYLLLLASFRMIYRSFELPRRGETVKIVLFYGILVFYAMLLSAKWPLAIFAFLLLVFGLLHERGRDGLASLALLLAMHFRFEGLILWGIHLFLLLFHSLRSRARSAEPPETAPDGLPDLGADAPTKPAPTSARNLLWMMTVAVCSVLLLAAWPVYQYSQHQEFLPGPTNSGGVLYRSLGQLPGNPWGREDNDGAASRYAKSQGVEDAWGIEGNRVLLRGFLNDVSAYPAFFAAKVIYNGVSIARGGLYTTEIRSLTVRGDMDRDAEQRELLAKYQGRPFSLFPDVFSFNAHTYAMLGQLLLRIISGLLLGALLITLLARLFLGGVSPGSPYVWMIAGQFLLIGVAQYQERHVSAVLILFLFALYTRRPGGPRVWDDTIQVFPWLGRV